MGFKGPRCCHCRDHETIAWTAPGSRRWPNGSGRAFVSFIGGDRFLDLIVAAFLRGLSSDLFSVISVTGNGDMFLHNDYMFKDEMVDERVSLLLDRIKNKFDWSNTEWPIIEPEETGMEEADTQNKGEQVDKSVDDTDVASDVETSTVNVSGKGKRKIHDEGAETRKKKLLYRMGKMESEVSQLRDAMRLSDERAETSKSEAGQDQAPSHSKDEEAPPKSLHLRAKLHLRANAAGKNIAVETNLFDFGLSTQDVGDLSQATFVDGFDLSQVKVEKDLKSRPFDIPLRCGPTILDSVIAKLLMDPSEWLHNWEIDAAMFVFRERTSLNRWKPYRVAFMTTVFSNMIKKEYSLFKNGRRKYNLHNLLVQYGKGVLPPHGVTHEIWNVDVDRLYVPVHISGNHWVALFISFATRSIDVFDCSSRRSYPEVEAFAHMIPRIVKAVQPANQQNDFLVGPYTVEYDVKVHSSSVSLFQLPQL
ncbi:hypothetical protein Bca52824_013711 [Brassica carinata]|uniref:Ubiquitin-like protease family profile domain-containing protein n=1 Tax=Brassica carinata TaxID=52824 RepID=A0A8X8B3P2_BRACI|nr:hypothetical protein Bca52824_013711 [Brassica carinata]